MILIKTEYRTDTAGRGKVTAKGGGKQATVTFDFAQAGVHSHVAAAAAVCNKLGDNWAADDIVGAWELPNGGYAFRIK